jgi:hypothetical protein
MSKTLNQIDQKQIENAAEALAQLLIQQVMNNRLTKIESKTKKNGRTK